MIRFTFLHDHPGSSRKNGLEPGGRVQLRSVALVQDDQFLIFGADNKNFQGLCDALYIWGQVCFRIIRSMSTLINYFVCFDLFNQFCKSKRKCQEAVSHVYADLWEIKLGSQIFTESRFPTQHTARLLWMIKKKHRLWVCFSFRLHLILWMGKSQGWSESQGTCLPAGLWTDWQGPWSAKNWEPCGWVWGGERRGKGASGIKNPDGGGWDSLVDLGFIPETDIL